MLACHSVTETSQTAEPSRREAYACSFQMQKKCQVITSCHCVTSDFPSCGAEKEALGRKRGLSQLQTSGRKGPTGFLAPSSSTLIPSSGDLVRKLDCKGQRGRAQADTSNQTAWVCCPHSTPVVVLLSTWPVYACEGNRNGYLQRVRKIPAWTRIHLIHISRRLHRVCISQDQSVCLLSDFSIHIHVQWRLLKAPHVERSFSFSKMEKKQKKLDMLICLQHPQGGREAEEHCET